MITDHQISTLCDVARSAGTDLSADKLASLEGLIASGYVAAAETPAGQAVLDERGVGANES
jgi:hypothetical protein